LLSGLHRVGGSQGRTEGETAEAAIATEKQAVRSVGTQTETRVTLAAATQTEMERSVAVRHADGFATARGGEGCDNTDGDERLGSGRNADRFTAACMVRGRGHTDGAE